MQILFIKYIITFFICCLMYCFFLVIQVWSRDKRWISSSILVDSVFFYFFTFSRTENLIFFLFYIIRSVVPQISTLVIIFNLSLFSFASSSLSRFPFFPFLFIFYSPFLSLFPSLTSPRCFTFLFDLRISSAFLCSLVALSTRY